MKRRAYLTSVVAVIGSGCLGSLTEDTDPDNPWGQETLTVGMTRQAGSGDYSSHVTDALDFWEDNAEQYAGYPIQFEYLPNEESADIEIIFVEGIDRCGKSSSDEIAGCAPIIEGEPPETAEVRIEHDIEEDRMTEVIKHEIGHVLGLTHDDEPQSVMSDEVDQRFPDREERVKIVETFNDGVEKHDEGSELYGDGSDLYEDEEFQEAAETFEDAKKCFESAADLFIEAENQARSIEEPEAADICSEAAERCIEFSYSMLSIKRAAEEYDEGNFDRGDDQVNKHQEHHQEAQKHQIRGSLLVEVLGLD